MRIFDREQNTGGMIELPSAALHAEQSAACTSGPSHFGFRFEHGKRFVCKVPSSCTGEGRWEVELSET